MRELSAYKDKNKAQRLADALEVAGIETELREGAEFSIWIIDDDQLKEAEQLLQSLDLNVDYSGAAQKIRQQRSEDAKPMVALRKRAAGNFSLGKMTAVLIGACVVIGLASSLGDTSSEIIRTLLIVPIFEEYGSLMAMKNLVWSEPWRVLSPVLIHFGFFHLAFNMYWLHHFGNQIESLHGSIWLLLLIAVSGIPGNLLQFKIGGPLFGGMSGVNYGLFAFVWMQARYGNKSYGIESREVMILMGWLILCLSGLMGPIANAAHAAGLIVGVLVGLPTYFAFRKTHKLKAEIKKGSWQDLNVKGWARFEKEFVQPYMPFWFVIIGLVVLWVDWAKR